MFGLSNHKALRDELQTRIEGVLASFAAEHPQASVAGIGFRFGCDEEDPRVWVQLDAHTDPDWRLGMSQDEIAFPTFAEIEFSSGAKPIATVKMGKLLLEIHNAHVQAGLYAKLPGPGPCSVAIEDYHGEWGWLDETQERKRKALDEQHKAASAKNDPAAIRRQVRAWLAQTFETFGHEHADKRFTGIQISFDSNPALREVWVCVHMHTDAAWEPGKSLGCGVHAEIRIDARKPPKNPAVGEMLRELHQQGITDGLYAPLPRTDRCTVTIRQMLDDWTWPDRRDDGLVP